MRRYLIAAGTVVYRDAEKLPSVPGDLAEIGTAFAELGYERALEVVDPATDRLRRELGSWARAQDRAQDALVVYYTGHGERNGNGHFLLCADSEVGGLLDTALRTEDIAAILISQGVRRLLVIVDTCYAEAGTARAVRAMAELLRAELVPKQDGEYREPLAFAIIAAARARELADQGVFARAFRAALSQQEIGGHRQPYLYLEAVVDSINQQFDHDGVLQHATCAILSHESRFGFLPNPRFAEDLPPEGTDLAEQRVWLSEQARRRREELAEHFGPRGRGTDIGAEAGHYFIGRVAVLSRLAAWLRSDSADRAVVITGSPGAGKSAVLGRLVVLADPATRAGIPPETIVAGTDPGIGAVDVAIHARHKTVAELVAGIAASAGLDTDSVDELVAGLAERGRPLVVFLDALDEAGTADDSEPDRIARELLRRLAVIPGVRLIVGTRRHLVDACGPDFAVLDLDNPQWISLDDLAGYAELLLLAPHGPGSHSVYDTTTAPPIAAGIAETAYPNYLVSRLTARTLAARDVVVPTPPGWQRSLPAAEPREAHAAGPAFLWALAEQLGAEEQRARELLTPLAFAEGVGLPWGTVWPAVAASITGRAVDSADIDWLLAASGMHVVEALDERNRSVYRLYHESFADQLRADAPPDTRRRVVDALLGLVPTHPDRVGRNWQAADPYILRHLATHAAACGRLDELVLDPEFLLAAERAPLLRALEWVTDDQAMLARAAYEQCVHLLNVMRPFLERASILDLTAHLAGARSLATALADVPGLPWRTHWAQVSGGELRQRNIGLHEHEVTAVAYVDLDATPSLVTGDSNGAVRIWTLSSGELTHQLIDVHQDVIRELAVLSTPNGELVVILTAKGAVSGWFPNTGAVIGPFRATRDAGADRLAATMYRGEPVIAVSAGNRVWVWNLRTTNRLASRRVSYRGWTLETLAFVTWNTQPAVVAATSWLPLVFGTSTWRKDPFQLVMFTLGGKMIETWRDKDVDAVGAWDIDGRPVIVTCHNSGKSAPARLAPQLTEIRIQGRHSVTNWAASALVQHKGEPLAVVYQRGDLQLWNIVTKQPVGALRITKSQSSSNVSAKPVGFDAEGTTWITVPAGRSALAIDIGRQESLTTKPAEPVTGLALWRVKHRNNPPCVMATVDSPYGADSMHIYNLETGELLESGCNNRIIKAIIGGGLTENALTPLLVSIHYDHRSFGKSTVAIKDVDRSVVDWSYELPRNQFYKACHSLVYGGSHIVILVLTERVVYLRLPAGKAGEFKIPYNYSSAALTMNGRTMLFSKGSSKLTAIDLDTHVTLWSREQKLSLRARALSAGWADDIPIVVGSAGADGTDIVSLDARTGEPIGRALVGHALPPAVIEIGRLHGRPVVISGGADRTVRVWDVLSAQQVALIEVGAVVTAVAFLSDDAVVIGTETGVLRIDIQRH